MTLLVRNCARHLAIVTLAGISFAVCGVEGGDVFTRVMPCAGPVKDVHMGLSVLCYIFLGQLSSLLHHGCEATQSVDSLGSSQRLSGFGDGCHNVARLLAHSLYRIQKPEFAMAVIA